MPRHARPQTGYEECWRLESLGCPIVLSQRAPDDFTVVYGLQVRDGLTYDDACAELGMAIMHALACNGKVDNREEGE